MASGVPGNSERTRVPFARHRPNGPPFCPPQGVRYLHHQHFPHGRLKSRNCVVDERFVLKVTDHGYAGLLDARRAPRPRPAPEGQLTGGQLVLRPLFKSGACEAGERASSPGLQPPCR